jgi:uncharacterized protein
MLPIHFIGRAPELEKLGNFLHSPKSQIAVVYGRRRIGKSLLLTQALKGRSALFFEGLEDRPKKQQLQHFMFQLRLQTGDTTGLNQHSKPPDSWKEAFLELFKTVKGKATTIVFDEFQWMANYRHEIVADLKYVWDKFFVPLPAQKLILCGSVVSFLIEKVIKSSALFGRVTTEMELGPFKLAETAELLAEKGLDEILEAQMVTGGIPQYLQLLAEYPSIRLAMQDLAFTPQGYFTHEYQRIFTSHFGKNPDFEAIVQALAHHPLGLYREALIEEAKLSPGGQLTSHLRDLASAGFINAATPFDKDEHSRHVKYTLVDAYLRFYFSFIKPDLKKIRSAQSPHLFAALSQTGHFHAWMGVSFEYLCLQHTNIISRILGFSGIDFTAGPYFSPTHKERAGMQVDLVFNRADHVLTVCEMKYSHRPVGVEVIAEMEKKIRLLEPITGRRTLQRVLIVRDKVSQQLAESSYFYRIIEARELLENRGKR